MKRKHKLDECDSCRFKTTVTEYGYSSAQRRMAGEKRWLCALCAGSFAGVSHDYNYEDWRVLSTVCNVGNAILYELRAARRRKEKGKDE